LLHVRLLRAVIKINQSINQIYLFRLQHLAASRTTAQYYRDSRKWVR